MPLHDVILEMSSLSTAVRAVRAKIRLLSGVNKKVMCNVLVAVATTEHLSANVAAHDPGVVCRHLQRQNVSSLTK